MASTSRFLIRNNSSQIKKGLTVASIDYLHVGRIVMESSVPDSKRETLLQKIASLSTYPTSVRIAKTLIESGEANQNPSMDIIEKKHLSNISCHIYMQAIISETNDLVHLYGSFRGDLILEALRATQNKHAVNIADYGKIHYAASEIPDFIRILMSIRYHFGEKITNATLIDSPD